MSNQDVDQSADNQRVAAFLSELAELSKKHNIVVRGPAGLAHFTLFEGNKRCLNTSWWDVKTQSYL